MAKEIKEVQEVETREVPEIDYSKFSFKEADIKAHKSESERRNREALRLVRVIISCNNSNKQSYSGEIFCVRNKVLPEIKKFVPFNKATHIPQIMLNMIKEKKYQKFKEERLDNGSKIMRPYLINEYNIQVLDPLTTEEFEAIKQHQLAEGKVGE